MSSETLVTTKTMMPARPSMWTPTVTSRSNSVTHMWGANPSDSPSWPMALSSAHSEASHAMPIAAMVMRPAHSSWNHGARCSATISTNEITGAK